MIAAVLWLTACAGLPRPRDPVEWWGLLPDASILIYGKMAPIRSALTERLSKDSDLREVIRRTNEFYGALNLGASETDRAFSVLLLGDFPKVLAGWSLGWNRNWRHQGGTPEQWIHTSQSLAVMLPEDGVVLARNLPWTPREAQPERRSVPVQLAQRAGGHDLFLFVAQPLTTFLGELGDRVPVDALFLPLTFEGRGWTGSVEIQLREERLVHVVLGLLRLTRSVWIGELQNLGLELDPAAVELSSAGAVIRAGPLTVPLRLVDRLVQESEVMR